MRCAALLFAVVAVPGMAEPLLRQATTIRSQKSQVGAEQSPFVGSWTANLSRSKLDPNHQFERATLEFALAGDTVTITHGGINASGQQESGVIELQADGKEHPFPGAPGIVHVTRWIGKHVLETVGKKGDQVTGRGVYEVSADGKTLTATVSGTDASGTEFEQVIVFDRE
jgi:hypothetical protein